MKPLKFTVAFFGTKYSIVTSSKQLGQPLVIPVIDIFPLMSIFFFSGIHHCPLDPKAFSLGFATSRNGDDFPDNVTLRAPETKHCGLEGSGYIFPAHFNVTLVV